MFLKTFCLIILVTSSQASTGLSLKKSRVMAALRARAADCKLSITLLVQLGLRLVTVNYNSQRSTTYNSVIQFTAAL